MLRRLLSAALILGLLAVPMGCGTQKDAAGTHANASTRASGWHRTENADTPAERYKDWADGADAGAAESGHRPRSQDGEAINEDRDKITDAARDMGDDAKEMGRDLSRAAKDAARDVGKAAEDMLDGADKKS